MERLTKQLPADESERVGLSGILQAFSASRLEKQRQRRRSLVPSVIMDDTTLDSMTNDGLRLIEAFYGDESEPDTIITMTTDSPEQEIID